MTQTAAVNEKATTRDDRILPLTRVVAGIIIVVLVLAVIALYFNPDQTDQNFAWTIKPRMTAMAMGAGYLMGAYFFVRVLTLREWHRVAAGFLPITAFTIAMALATLLHWDRFHQTQLMAQLWAGIYAVTPFLVPLVWWLNQRTVPRVVAANDLRVPDLLRRVSGGMGLLLLAAALLFFVQPDIAIRVWPWMLTPLTARVMAGWMMLPAIGGLYLSRVTRWSGWRVLIETVTIFCVYFLLAAVFVWDDWSQANPLTWLVLLAMLGAAILLPATYAHLQASAARA